MRMKGNGSFGGMTDAEIGRRLGMSANLVGRVAKRAMAKVKERMAWDDEQLNRFLRTQKR